MRERVERLEFNMANEKASDIMTSSWPHSKHSRLVLHLSLTTTASRALSLLQLLLLLRRRLLPMVCVCNPALSLATEYMSDTHSLRREGQGGGRILFIFLWPKPCLFQPKLCLGRRGVFL